MKHLKLMLTAAGILLFIAGMVILFHGADIGTRIANQELHANGGSMDTSLYQFMMSSNTLTAQLTGTVLAIVGGICAIIFGSKSME